MNLFLLTLLFFLNSFNFQNLTQDTLSVSDTLNTETVIEITEQEILLAQINEIYNEIRNLRNELSTSDTNKLAEISDRIGVIEQRILALDSRIERLHTEVGGIELNFTLIVFLIIAVGFLTIAAVFIQRKKFVDPLRDRVQKFDNDLNNIDPDKSNRLADTLRELGENDPKVAQLLRKHKLD